ncbi:rhodanese-like domain-containing protein [Thermodesulfobacteriota bacterium]
MNQTKTIRTVLGLALTLILISGYAGAAWATESKQAEKADDWKFHDIVDVGFVMKYAVMPQPENVVIIDSRPKRSKYDKGFIPTAISLPDRKFDKMVDKLPKDKSTLIIFYCGGPT